MGKEEKIVDRSDFPQNSRFTFAYLTFPFVCSTLTMSPPKSSGFCHSQPIQPTPVHLSKLRYHLLSSPNQNSARFVYFTSQTHPAFHVSYYHLCPSHHDFSCLSSTTELNTKLLLWPLTIFFIYVMARITFQGDKSCHSHT